MSWSTPHQFTCCDCSKVFRSKAYNVDRCPDCRAVYVRRSHLENYHRRRTELMVQRCDRRKRDTAYDGGSRLGAPESVYSSMCAIKITRSVGRCRGCGNARNLVNGYCDVCRSNGANEAQVMNPRQIR